MALTGPPCRRTPQPEAARNVIKPAARHRQPHNHSAGNRAQLWRCVPWTAASLRPPPRALSPPALYLPLTPDPCLLLSSSSTTPPPLLPPPLFLFSLFLLFLLSPLQPPLPPLLFLILFSPFIFHFLLVPFFLLPFYFYFFICLKGTVCINQHGHPIGHACIRFS